MKSSDYETFDRGGRADSKDTLVLSDVPSLRARLARQRGMLQVWAGGKDARNRRRIALGILREPRQASAPRCLIGCTRKKYDHVTKSDFAQL